MLHIRSAQVVTFGEPFRYRGVCGIDLEAEDVSSTTFENIGWWLARKVHVCPVCWDLLMSALTQVFERKPLQIVDDTFVKVEVVRERIKAWAGKGA